MQSTKRFNHALNAFDLCAPSNQSHDFFLDCRFTDEEALDEFTIHKPEWFLCFTDTIAESTKFVEWHVSRRVDVCGNCGLQAHKEVLMLCVDERKKVDRTFGLLTVISS
jgi:hypothetical protein